MEFFEFGGDIFLVFLIGDAEPDGIGGKNFHLEALGMHEVQFGIMMIMNLGLGLLTPPVGQVLFVGCSVGEISMERLTKALLPQMAFMVLALILITYIPAITMWLPRLFGYIK